MITFAQLRQALAGTIVGLKTGRNGYEVLVGDSSIFRTFSLQKAAEVAMNQAQSLSHQSRRSEEHTSELQSLMRISYAVFCLKKKKTRTNNHNNITEKTT